MKRRLLPILITLFAVCLSMSVFVFALPNNNPTLPNGEDNIPDSSVKSNPDVNESEKPNEDMFGKFTDTEMFSETPDGTNIPDDDVEENSTMQKNNPESDGKNDNNTTSLVLGIVLAILAAIAVIVFIIIFIPKNDGNVNKRK